MCESRNFATDLEIISGSFYIIYMKFKKPIKATIRQLDGRITSTLIEVESLSDGNYLTLGTKMYIVTKVSRSEIKLEECIPFGEVITVIGREL